MDDAPPHAADPVADAVRAALETVIDPCCRDRGISVADMGLVSDVAVDHDGRARVEIMLTSGWCPFQVDLTEEVTAAAADVAGVNDVVVDITLDRVWSPDRMRATARERLRLLPDPNRAGDRDAWLARNPLPVVATGPRPPTGGQP